MIIGGYGCGKICAQTKPKGSPVCFTVWEVVGYDGVGQSGLWRDFQGVM